MDALTTLMVVELGLSDIERIVVDEKTSFPPFLQASKETIRLRLSLGHIMLGAVVEDKLIGKICFSYANFSPNNPESFPATFDQFSRQPRPACYNAAFVYNLNVQPEYRGNRAAYRLIEQMIIWVQKDGCRCIVLDGRPSSYAGSSCPQENVPFKPEVKAVFDRYLATGQAPTNQELCQDPTLALYYRLDGKFLWLKPNFLPEDKPAGGWRVIMYKEV